MEYVEDAYPVQGYSLLPSDPVKRAQLRMLAPIPESFFGAWFPIYMKKAAVEPELSKLLEALQKQDDLIAKHGSDSSPYVLGTDKPTQLDVHLFAGVSRVYYLKGSAMEESVWNHIPWTNYPRVVKLIETMCALPELQGTLALPR